MKKVVKCDRCKRRYRGHGEWNTVFSKGFLTGHICPDCQTPEEHTEAAINEATVDYSTVTEVVGEQKLKLIAEDMYRRLTASIDQVMTEIVASGTSRPAQEVIAQTVDLIEKDLPDGYGMPLHGTRREFWARQVEDELQDRLAGDDD